MKKRTMVMALTAVAVAGALTACGGGTKDNSGAAADTKAAESKEAGKTEETSAEASEEKKVFPAGTVTVYAMGIRSTDSSGLKPGWIITEILLRMLRLNLYRQKALLISVRRSL